MSIEIRELVIKSTIVDRPADDGATAAATAAAPVAVLREAILRECRQMVLSLLRERGER
jgi:hypothetical protein